METHPELELEQTHIDKAYEHLERMRSRAKRRGDDAILGEDVGMDWGLFARDAMVNSAYRRAAALSVADLPLAFGRIDTDEGETFYIGRTTVYDEHQDPLVVDWRAPVAEPFYRATAKHPMGLTRRRHFLCRGSKLLRIDDDMLQPDADEKLPIVGEGALIAALSQSRSGRMRDAAATIQVEQDEIIRAPLDRVLVVQGAPGTGKTIVALHRAAYLLYTHRRALERSGILLVGPNPLFLRYIEDVLPALGERSVNLATPETLVEGVGETARESHEVARIKGDLRMAEVVAKGIVQLSKPLVEPLLVSYQSRRLEISPSDSIRLIKGAERATGTHNSRRPMFERSVMRHLYRSYLNVSGRRAHRPGRRGRGTLRPPSDFVEEVKRDPNLRAAINDMWPTATAERFVRHLFGDDHMLKSAASEVLSDEDVEVLQKHRASRGWSSSDIALIDEAHSVLGPTSQRRRRRSPREPTSELREFQVDQLIDDMAGAQGLDPHMKQTIRERFEPDEAALSEAESDEDGFRKFGHLLVDEAHDLSPMQWRMLGRRSTRRSMTIVGDLQQRSGPWKAKDWPETLASIHPEGEPEIRYLTINYRTTEEILSFALPLVSPAGMPPVRSVRRGGEPPKIVSVGRDGLRAEVEKFSSAEREKEGKIAILGPEVLLDEIRKWMNAESRFDPATLLDAQLVCLSVSQAKGLEFDSVIVVEPAQIMREQPQGKGALYVALTRATQRLAILHSDPLPPELQSATAGDPEASSP